MKNTRPGSGFRYRNSDKINFWGNQFDSLLELKYALSIHDEYEVLRSRIVIYYHHGTCTPAPYIKEGVRHYTPDFLIRHKKTCEAFLIEIKPRAAQHDPKLIIRKKVAEKYIQWKGYDWKYKVVFDDEIILDETAWQIFENCKNLKSTSSLRQWMATQENRYGKTDPGAFPGSISDHEIQYIIFGSRKTGT